MNLTLALIISVVCIALNVIRVLFSDHRII